MSASKSVIIIGSGVIGLSTGIALLSKIPSLKISIFDKETFLGAHASGRNSGVIHAGFYYSPETLKAKFCREGNEALSELASNNGLSLKKTGKVVVTKNSNEVPNLIELYNRGLENGVSLEMFESSELHHFEPLARTKEAFIWSPNTCVASPQEIIGVLAKIFENKGGSIFLGKKIENLTNSTMQIGGKVVEFDLAINCAGTQAIYFAHSMGIGHNLAQLPFIGLYRYTAQQNLPLKTLVYPVPDKNYPFLGAHFTISIDGKIKVGPTAIPIIGSEQYTYFSGVSLHDLQQSLKSFSVLALKNFGTTLKLASQEFPNLIGRNLIYQAIKIVPNASLVKSWETYKPGIRAQLIELKTGTFLTDFRIEKTRSVLHVLNSVSPGWTSAIPFGKWLAEESIELLG